ncbi:MAG: hypothetical protein K2Y03_00785 [Sphingomonas sp.]|nr:hypothetical protein [Sphingomonas sp.]
MARRPRHQFRFLLAALAGTLAILFVFSRDAHFERPYKRNIIYVEQWPLTRTDEEVRAQQRIDAAKKAVEQAKLDKLQKARQAEFKKIDDALTRWGL